MDITPLVNQGLQLIQSYAADGFKISGQEYKISVIVTPEAAQGWNAPSAVDDLTAADFEEVIVRADELDVILLGTGAKMAFLSTDLKSDLDAQLAPRGLMIECMDTGAACRTFNVLAAEGRRVAAMLLMPI